MKSLVDINRARYLVSVVVLAMLVALASCSDGVRQNLVLISLDTVRQDHLPAYGYHRDTAPTVSALAEHGALVVNAFTQEVNTAPSHASMFTARYPHEHGCLSNRHRLSLSPDVQTLAQVLSWNGLRTGGFVSGFPMHSDVSALNPGFEVWDEQFFARRDGMSTTRAAMEWLEQIEGHERFFLFLHLYDVHGPYSPPQGYEDLFVSEQPGRRLESIPPYQRLHRPDGSLMVRLNDYVDRYDAMIRYVDDCVAQLLTVIPKRRTLVVVLSDHGETLGERFHVLDHGGQLFDEQMRIPLVLSGPGIRTARITEPVETVDLMPTVLDLLAVDWACDGPGSSLAGMLVGEDVALDRRFVHATGRAVASRHADRRYDLDERRSIVAVRSLQWKLIRYPGVEADAVELFDLTNDPKERNNVAQDHGELRERLLAALDAWYEEPSSDPIELSDEVRDGLRALGYF